MKKQQVIEKLERAYRSFTESFAGLSDAQMLQPGVTGDWSVKDLLAHVTWWEAEALKHLPGILQGIRPPRYSVTYGGIDAFNAKMTAAHRALSLDEALSQAAETHARLLGYLETVAEEHFATETRFRRRLKLDTYGHYPIHAEGIWKWRADHGF